MARSRKGRQQSGFTDEMKLVISEGRCGPTQRFVCKPPIPTEELTPDKLQPGHLDELSSLARSCLEGVADVRGHAQRLVGNDDDRWWIQASLVSAMTTALRAGMFLSAGLEQEILQAYPSSVTLSAAGMTCGNAHRLATAVTLDVVCRAWSAVYRRQCRRPVHAGMLYTYRRPLVSMRPEDKRDFPLFKYSDVPAVVGVIQSYPPFDAQEILARIQWENAKVKERRVTRDVIAQALAQLNARRRETAESPANPLPADPTQPGGGGQKGSPPAQGKEPADDSAWVTAQSVWKGEFLSYKEFTVFLNKHPAIRCRHPICKRTGKEWKQRLEIHAGDWTTYSAKANRAAFESLDEADRKRPLPEFTSVETQSPAVDPEIQAGFLKGAARLLQTVRGKKSGK